MVSASFTISSTCLAKDSSRTSRSSWSLRARGLFAPLSLKYMAAKSSSDVFKYKSMEALGAMKGRVPWPRTSSRASST